MKPANVEGMTVPQLVEYFTAIALAQDQAMRIDDNAAFNRLFFQMEAVEEELKRRKGDQRSALLRLLDHPNAQVRLKSAIATLALAPQAARQALQVISDRQEYPQAADARGMMRAVDDGTFIPG
jgi:hypothetical protein